MGQLNLKRKESASFTNYRLALQYELAVWIGFVMTSNLISDEKLTC